MTYTATGHWHEHCNGAVLNLVLQLCCLHSLCGTSANFVKQCQEESSCVVVSALVNEIVQQNLKTKIGL